MRSLSKTIHLQEMFSDHSTNFKMQILVNTHEHVPMLI